MATNLVRLLVREVLLDGPEGASLTRIEEHLRRLNNDQPVEDDLRDYILDELRETGHVYLGRWQKGVPAPTGRKATQQKAGADANGSNADHVDESVPWAKAGTVLGKVVAEEGDERSSLADLQAKYQDNLRAVGKTQGIIDAVGRNLGTASSSAWAFLFHLTRCRHLGMSYANMLKVLNAENSTVFFLAKMMQGRGMTYKFKRAERDSTTANVNWLVATQFLDACPYLAPDMLKKARKAAAAAGADGEDEDNDDEDDEADGAGDENPIRVKAEQEEPGLIEMPQNDVGRLLRRDDEAGSEDDDEGSNDGDTTSGAAESSSRRRRSDAAMGEDDLQDEKLSAEDVKDGLISEDMTSLRGLLSFPPLENALAQQHLLADRDLMRFRILHLLDSSKNKATIRSDFIYRIGLVSPGKNQRKAFHQYMRSLVEEGCIELCKLRRPLKSNPNRIEVCLRLTEAGEEHLAHSKSSAQNKELRKQYEILRQQLSSSQSTIFVESTFERQMLDLIAANSAAGCTIEDFRTHFKGSKDRERDLTHLLDAMKHSEKQEKAPQHGDWPLFSALEQSGRVRRARYWTQANLPKRVFKDSQREYDRAALTMWPMLAPEETRTTVEDFTAVIDKFTPLHKVKPRRNIPSNGTTYKRAQGAASASADPNDDLPTPKARGRPRKHFDAKALALAEKYKAQKRAREESSTAELAAEDAGVDGGGTTARSAVTKRPRTSKRRQAIAVMDGDTNLDLEGNIDPALAQIDNNVMRVDGEQPEETNSNATETQGRGPDDTAAADERGQGDVLQFEQTGTENEGIAGVLPRRDPAKASRINLTVQKKYDATLAFLTNARIIEAGQFEFEYGRFLQETYGQNEDIAPYDMDRKLRKKIINLLVQDGHICETTMMAPADHRKQLRIIYVTSLSEDEKVAFLQGVRSGEIALKRSILPKREEYSDLGKDEIDLPDKFFSEGAQSRLDAANLEELLGNADYRRSLFLQYNVRNAYTRCIPGIGARAYFFHSACIGALRASDVEDASQFVQADMTLDLAWWRKEATLQQFRSVMLFAPNLIDEAEILVHKEDADRLKMQDLDETAIKVMMAVDEAEMIQTSLKPLLDILVELGLAARVQVTDNAASAYGSYRFATHSSRLTWDAENRQILKIGAQLELRDTPVVKEVWSGLMPGQHLQQRNLVEAAENRVEIPLLPCLVPLKNEKSWRTSFRVYRSQLALLNKARDLGVSEEVVNDMELLKRLANASVSHTYQVQRYYESLFKVEAEERLPASLLPSAQVELIGTERGPVHGPMTARQAALAINKKKRHEKQRKKEVMKALEDAFDEVGRVRYLTENEKTHVRSSFKQARDLYKNGKFSKDSIASSIEVVKRSLLHEETLEESRDALLGSRKNKPSTSGMNASRPKGRKQTSTAADTDGTIAPSVTRKARTVRTTWQRKGQVGWTQESCELLRDCAVILRARDRFREPFRVRPPRQWKALLKVFPDVHQLTPLTLQFDRLEATVGEQLYLEHLEAEWTRIWESDRGKPELPDPDPLDPDCDLQKHVDYLRKMIDKHEVEMLAFRGTGNSLPIDVGVLHKFYDRESPAGHRHGSEGRVPFERQLAGESGASLKPASLARRPFTMDPRALDVDFDLARRIPLQCDARGQYISRAGCKMLLATRASDFSVEAAEAFKHANDEELEDASGSGAFDCAIEELNISRLISRKREGASAPGRQLEYTDESKGFKKIDTLTTKDPFEVAESFATDFEIQGTQRNDTLDSLATSIACMRLDALESDEKTAACIYSISNGLARVHIDMDDLDYIHTKFPLNAKKAKDSEVEFLMSVERKPASIPFIPTIPTWVTSKAIFDEILASTPGKDALQDWARATMLDDFWAQVWTNTIAAGEDTVNEKGALRLQITLVETGTKGAGQREIAQLRGAPFGIEDDELEEIITAVTPERLPPAFWSGVSDTRLIASKYAKAWTVSLADDGNTRMQPHPWLDCYGNTSEHKIWRAALEHVLYAIITRPGITLDVLVDALRNGPLERPDVWKVLEHLSRFSVIEQVWTRDPSKTDMKMLIYAQDDSEIALFPRLEA